MKMYEGVDIKNHVSVDQFEESGVPYSPGSFTPGEYSLDRRLGGTHGQSGLYGEEDIYRPYRDSKSHTSVVQPLVSRYIDCDKAASNISELNDVR
jgi:hypothetical protein